MPGSEPGPTRPSRDRQKASTFYRRPLGVAWLIAVVLIPLLFGAIGYGALDRSRTQTEVSPEPSGTLPTLTEPGFSDVPPPAFALAPLSIVWNGNQITLNGDMPSEEAKRALLDTVIEAVGQDVNIFDDLEINPDVKALDFSSAGPVFDAAATIRDFRLVVDGDTVTLAGTATSTDSARAVEDAAARAWQNVNLVDQIEISEPTTPSETPPTGG
jgi:peptidoglycan-binding protein ArfA